MRYYEASSTITSSPEAVWAVLTDGAAWPSWDSGVDRVDGQIAPGEKITIRSQAAPGRAADDDAARAGGRGQGPGAGTPARQSGGRLVRTGLVAALAGGGRPPLAAGPGVTASWPPRTRRSPAMGL
jgi:hypothetical protein